MRFEVENNESAWKSEQNTISAEALQTSSHQAYQQDISRTPKIRSPPPEGSALHMRTQAKTIALKRRSTFADRFHRAPKVTAEVIPTQCRHALIHGSFPRRHTRKPAHKTGKYHETSTTTAGLLTMAPPLVPPSNSIFVNDFSSAQHGKDRHDVPRTSVETSETLATARIRHIPTRKNQRHLVQ